MGAMAQGAELITAAVRLEELAASLQNVEAVAVDTEFFWERTFYPVLGLVQIATREGCWLVDTVRLPDIRALGPVLASPAITKVLHDAPQDLGILARATGALPKTVFDTRLAAGFAGFASTISLQALLREAQGIDLAKAETRSDWLRRPLSPSQLAYAADDVLHLLDLRDALLSRCADASVRGWLQEELSRLDEAALYADRDPRRMYLRVKGAGRLNARQLALLRELADWRENEARERDWPRAHVLSDDLLVSLALAAPVDLAALRKVADMPRNMPDAVAGRVLEAIARGVVCPDSSCPQPSPGQDVAAKRALKPKADRLLAHVKAACEPYGIDPALVASRSDADAHVQALERGETDGLPLAQGWRAIFTSTFIL